MQCFGGYWNDLADRPEGWETHLEASCKLVSSLSAPTPAPDPAPGPVPTLAPALLVLPTSNSPSYISNLEGAYWPTYVGEFSLATTDCQKYLNGGYSTPYLPPDVSMLCHTLWILVINLLCK